MIGAISLSIFLLMALMQMKLLYLVSLALLILVVLFARFAIFRALGKNYPAPQEFFVIPIVDSVLIDFLNAGAITTFF